MLDDKDLKAIEEFIAVAIETREDHLRGDIFTATESSEARLRSDAVSFIDISIMPRLDECCSHMEKLEDKVDRLDCTMRDISRRIDRKFDCLVDILCDENGVQERTVTKLGRMRATAS